MNAGDDLSKTLRTLFESAMDLPAEERDAFVEQACKQQPKLCTRLKAMVAAADDEQFLSDPTLEPSDIEGASAQSSDTAPVAEGADSEIGPYKLVQKVGEGGFGHVFLAEQRRPVRRRVALKIVKLGMDTEQVVARFEQERQALAVMDHPNVAKVFDAGSTPAGRPFFVMEFCEGEPITRYCDRHRLGIAERLELFVQVCQATQHAHQKGIIHRDLKPGNVLVTTRDDTPQAKVIDFGIAKATAGRLTEKTFYTEHRQLIGTPEYMSPEQADGAMDIDTRTDVYSLGVLLYELLTGETPFDGTSLRSAAYAEICRILTEVDPPRPSTKLSQSRNTLGNVAANRRLEPRRLSNLIEGELDWIAMKALEKDRRRRYSSPGELADDLQRYIRGDAVEAVPPSRSYQLKKFVRRNRGLVASAAAVAAALLLGVIGFAWQAQRVADQRDKAQAALAAEELARQAEAEARAEAEDRQVMAEGVNDFFAFEVLALANTDRTDGGPATTLVEAIDRAAARVDVAFPDYPLVAARVHRLIGVSYTGMGRYQDALAEHEKVVDLEQATLPPSDPRLLKSREQLANAYASLHRLDEAEAMYRQILEHPIDRTAFQMGEPDRPTWPRTGLAQVLLRRNEFAEALPLLEADLADQRRLLGDRHSETLETLGWLHRTLWFLGRREEALAHAEQLLNLQREHFAPSYPGTVSTMQTLGDYYRILGDVDRGIALRRESDALEVQRRGADHPERLRGLADLAFIIGLNRGIEEADPIFDEALQLARASPLDMDYVIFSILRKKGIVHRDGGDLAGAEPLLLEAHTLAERILPPNHPRRAGILESLATLYERKGDSEQAADWRQRFEAASEQ